jgi:ribosome-binding protein aMBF1 (putative translation factor)
VLRAPCPAAFDMCAKSILPSFFAKSTPLAYSSKMEAEEISPEQCRAARALVSWSQDDLCSRAKVAKRTVQLFELGQRQPYVRTMQALRRALEAAGVEFIDEDGGGAGVRLAKPAKRKRGK